jgi:hypothetical protein
MRDSTRVQRTTESMPAMSTITKASKLMSSASYALSRALPLAAAPCQRSEVRKGVGGCGERRDT